MKIEFIKETKADGKEIYFTKVDGYYISDSLYTNRDKAKITYDNIINNKGKINFEEVLESIEIN